AGSLSPTDGNIATTAKRRQHSDDSRATTARRQRAERRRPKGNSRKTTAERQRPREQHRRDDGDPGGDPGRDKNTYGIDDGQRAKTRRAMDRHTSFAGPIWSINSRSQRFSTATPAWWQAARATSVAEANWSPQTPSAPTRTLRAPRLPTYSMTAFAPPCSAAKARMLATSALGACASVVSVVSEPSAMPAAYADARAKDVHIVVLCDSYYLRHARSAPLIYPEMS